jgi:hypothetical protein
MGIEMLYSILKKSSDKFGEKKAVCNDVCNLTYQELHDKTEQLANYIRCLEVKPALFNYIEGDIQSWESTGAYTFPEENNADGTGNHKKEA